MESPSKRLKQTSLGDFVPFNFEDEENKYGYGEEEAVPQAQALPRAPRAAYQQHDRKVLQDRRHAQDKPKSKHTLPGNTPWILIRTKFQRRFVHNTQTKESLWRIPANVLQLVIEFERLEAGGQAKGGISAWEGQQLRRMQAESEAMEVNKAADDEGRRRRRRSESLQREDEAALIAELAAEEERAEEKDAKKAVKEVEHLEPQVGEFGYDSEGSYEYVEVTDDEGAEGESGDDAVQNEETAAVDEQDREYKDEDEDEDEAPVEFGEDDIAYQLAAMGQDYGLDPGEYGDGEDYEDWEEGAEGLPLTNEEAANLFHDLLDDHNVSPFTPWDKLISDTSPASILHDDRYTILDSVKARKDVWDVWAKEKAAQIHTERAQREKQDPRVTYMAFLDEKATPKLYWPEFKRKYKRDAEMTDRNLSDREREKMYREHIGRVKREGKGD